MTLPEPMSCVARFLELDGPRSGDHRATDWRLKEGGPVHCGRCHPPAPGIEIVRRVEPEG